MIKGKKVTLGCIEKANNAKIRCWRNDPENRKHFRVFKDISEDMQDAWYSSIGNNTNDKFVYFQICGIETGELLGVCSLSYIDWHLSSAEVSIMIGNEFAGKGYGTDALRTVCNYGFGEMNLHKIWCEIFDNNPASLCIFEKVGFVKEGILRHNYFSDGKYGDSYRLSLLKSEWEVK